MVNTYYDGETIRNGKEDRFLVEYYERLRQQSKEPEVTQDLGTEFPKGQGSSKITTSQNIENCNDIDMEQEQNLILTIKTRHKSSLDRGIQMVSRLIDLCGGESDLESEKENDCGEETAIYYQCLTESCAVAGDEESKDLESADADAENKLAYVSLQSTLIDLRTPFDPFRNKYQCSLRFDLNVERVLEKLESDSRQFEQRVKHDSLLELTHRLHNSGLLPLLKEKWLPDLNRKCARLRGSPVFNLEYDSRYGSVALVVIAKTNTSLERMQCEIAECLESALGFNIHIGGEKPWEEDLPGAPLSFKVMSLPKPGEYLKPLTEKYHGNNSNGGCQGLGLIRHKKPPQSVYWSRPQLVAFPTAQSTMTASRAAWTSAARDLLGDVMDEADSSDNYEGETSITTPTVERRPLRLSRERILNHVCKQKGLALQAGDGEVEARYLVCLQCDSLNDWEDVKRRMF